MKKRGVKPNAHTYTTLFRELAKHPSKKAVKIARSLYEGLKPDSPVPRSIIHTNAMLQLCAENRDMDTLWEIVDELPLTGPNAADNVTYTTILGAIHKTAKEKTERLGPVAQSKDALQIKATAVSEGKKIWAEIVERWRKGTLMVDQHLVFQMAFLLGFGGRRRDTFDMLALLEQTMNIKRPTALLDLVKAAKENTTSLRKETEEGPRSEDLFKPIDLSEIPRHTPSELEGKDLAYPRPTKRELSLILRACRFLAGGPSIGRRYWEILASRTGPFKVKPDRVTYHEYLRLLRSNHNSAEALRVIAEEMVPQGMAFANTFIIAMSTCARDINNPHALETASTLIDMMARTWAGSNPRVLSNYIQIVRRLVSPERLYSDTRQGGAFQNQDQKALYRSRLLTAIDHLLPHVKNLQKFLRGLGQRRDAADEKMYGEDEETPQGGMTPAALADEAESILKRIGGLMKDLQNPRFAGSLSSEDTDKLNSHMDELERILHAGHRARPSRRRNDSGR